ncbi:MAG: zinc-ribbon domain-containing protein [Candidatus Bathyarchaeia archaeon]
MSYCPKCGSKVEGEMSFCPKCGAPLNVENVATVTPETRPAYRRDEKTEEKSEKHEKREKSEKHEKHEKHEYGFMGPLIGGVILLFIGAALYLRVTGYDVAILWALFFVLIGVLIIVGGIYGAIMAGRRHPRT